MWRVSYEMAQRTGADIGGHQGEEMTTVFEAERTVMELRAELVRQWKANHDEHCGYDEALPCPLGADCYWPLPQVVTEAQAIDALEEMASDAFSELAEWTTNLTPERISPPSYDQENQP